MRMRFKEPGVNPGQIYRPMVSAKQGGFRLGRLRLRRRHRSLDSESQHQAIKASKRTGLASTSPANRSWHQRHLGASVPDSGHPHSCPQVSQPGLARLSRSRQGKQRLFSSNMIVSRRPRRIESVYSGSSIPRAQESPGYRIAFSRRERRKTCDIPAIISPPHLATPRGRTKTRTLSIYPTQQAKAEECIPCSGMALRVLQVPSQPPCPSRTSSPSRTSFPWLLSDYDRRIWRLSSSVLQTVRSSGDKHPFQCVLILSTARIYSHAKSVGLS